MSGGKLWFPLGEAIRVADLTLGAPDHGDSFADREDGIKTGPALEWVKDQGTYLMSNGRFPDGNGVPNPADIIYGRAYEPTGMLLNGKGGMDWYEVCRDICGGDDFAEYIKLDPQTLSTWRDALSDGFGWLVVEVMPDGETFAVLIAR